MLWKWEKINKEEAFQKYCEFFKDKRVLHYKFMQEQQEKLNKFSAAQILEWLEKTNKFIYNSILKGRTADEILYQIKI